MPDDAEKRPPALWEEADLPERKRETASARPEADREVRLKPVNRNQLLLRTVDVDRLVERDHLVRAIWELTGQLDLRGFTADVGSIEGEAGRPAFDPRLLISLWVFAYSEGVSSAREVERRCGYHPAYQWLTGCEVINHHTLSDFRVQYQEALGALFAQLLGVLSSEGLITLERVMHDGTKIKASASGNSFRREKTLRDHLDAAQERVRAMGDPRQEETSRRTVSAQERAARGKVARLEQALKEIAKVQATARPGSKSKRRVSETDPEARIMRQSDGGLAPSHNVQISTDAAHGIIVGVGVTQSPIDWGQLVPALQEIQRQMGRLPEQVVVDGGFTTREAVLATAELGVDLIGGTIENAAQAIARRREQRVLYPAFRAENFRYNREANTYTCPAGKVLRQHAARDDRIGVTRHVYRARASDCQKCSFRAQCCLGVSARTIVRKESVPTVATYVAKMQTDAAQKIYRLRSAVAEFPNAWLKSKIGLRQFCLRGLKKVRCEILWACLTYNIQQWVRLRWKERLASAKA
jgi:transposase